MHHLTTFPITTQLIMHNQKNQQKDLAQFGKKNIAISINATLQQLIL